MTDEEITTIPTGVAGSTPPAMKIDLSPIFNIPGVVWIGLIAAVTKWVSDSFPDNPYAPAVVIVLGMIAKLIQIYWPKPAPAPIPPMPAAAAAPIPMDSGDYTYVGGYVATPKETNRRKLARLLVG